MSVSDSFTKNGAIRLQGPHHVAWKSITTCTFDHHRCSEQAK